jgi:hypothetical protein
LSLKQPVFVADPASLTLYMQHIAYASVFWPIDTEIQVMY